MYFTVDPTKAAITPSIRDRKLGISEPRRLAATSTSVVWKKTPLEGYDEAGSGMPTRLEPGNQLLLWRQSTREEMLETRSK